MKKIIFLMVLLLSPMICYGYESITIHPEYIDQSTSKVSLNYALKSEYPIYNFTMNLKSDGILFERNTIYIPYIEENNIFYIDTTGHIINNSMDEYLIVVDVKYTLRDTSIGYIKIYKIYRINDSEMASSYQQQVEILNNATNDSINVSILENHTEQNIGGDNIFDDMEENISEDIEKNISEDIEKNISDKINYTEQIDNITEDEDITSPTTNVSTNIDENNITNDKEVNNKTSTMDNYSEEIQDENPVNYILYAILGLIFGMGIALLFIYIYTI